MQFLHKLMAQVMIEFVRVCQHDKVIKEFLMAITKELLLYHGGPTSLQQNGVWLLVAALVSAGSKSAVAPKKSVGSQLDRKRILRPSAAAMASGSNSMALLTNSGPS